jgi:hypothetical protein
VFGITVMLKTDLLFQSYGVLLLCSDLSVFINRECLCGLYL